MLCGFMDELSRDTEKRFLVTWVMEKRHDSQRRHDANHGDDENDDIKNGNRSDLGDEVGDGDTDYKIDRDERS